MAFERMGVEALDYDPCHYGSSATAFRGPKRDLKGDYVAFVGGAPFYGRFVEHPTPELVETKIGKCCVNLGVMNAGIDVFASDPEIQGIISAATVSYIQVLPAHNMSNRFYKVHPRRNDRFVAPSVLLETLFPEVDFTDFNFTRHMLSTLRRVSEDKFQMIIDEVQAAWVARMRLLLARTRGTKVLVYIEDRLPKDLDEVMGAEPVFVTLDMVAEVSKLAAGVVRYDGADHRTAHGISDMIFAPMEQQAAEELLPPACHAALAEVISKDLKRRL